MKVWIIDGGERWLTDTSALGDRATAELEADLERYGHAWYGDSALILAANTVRQMANHG